MWLAAVQTTIIGGGSAPRQWASPQDDGQLAKTRQGKTSLEV